MKPILLLLTICFYTTSNCQPLVRIEQQGKTGFIDTSGNVIINPRYESAGEFSQGYAPVRENGLYGYIDRKGNYIIPPTYDFAEPLKNNIASLYIDGKASYIVLERNKLVHKEVDELNKNSSDKLYYISTNEGGIILNKNGKEILSGVRYAVLDSANNVAIVEDNEHNQSSDNLQEQKSIGLIGYNGKFVIPYGIYSHIEHLGNGYTIVRDRKNMFNGLANTKGEVLFTIDDTVGHLSGIVSDGLMLCYLYKSKRPYDTYPAYLDTTGKIIISDTNYSGYEQFKYGRVFMRYKDQGYALLDTKGNRLNKELYDRRYGYFEKGVMLVQIGDKQLLIDTNGNTLREFEHDEINRYSIKDGKFIFGTETDDGTRLYGMSDFKGNIIIKPIMTEYETEFSENVLHAIVGGQLTYINQNGRIIWQREADYSTTILNTDYMARGYFYALPYQRAQAGNTDMAYQNPKVITSKNNFPPDKLSLTIRTEDTIIAGPFCFTVYIANNTNQDFNFNAQDGRLYMNMQALKDGKWKDIEYLPSSWCGNSYHTIKLESGLYWGLPAPIHDGRIKTKLRAKLRYIDPNNKKNEITIYSNEVDGKVNPAQFWRKREYYSMGLMDPYND